MRNWRSTFCVLVAVLFVFNFVISPMVFAQAKQDAEMEKKCKATKDGTETNQETRKACAVYFEQTGGATSAGEAAGAATTTGVNKGTVALTIIGAAAAGAAIAAASGGGGGGGGAVARHHSTPQH